MHSSMQTFRRLTKKGGIALLFLPRFFFLYSFCIHSKPSIDIKEKRREKKETKFHEYVDMNDNTIRRRKKNKSQFLIVCVSIV